MTKFRKLTKIVERLIFYISYEHLVYLTRICAAEMAVRYAALSACRKVHVCYYRQDAAKRQTAGIVFTHRPKIRFFAPQGRLVAPIRVKLYSTDGHLGPLGWAKFHVSRCRRVGMRPQKYQKFPLFRKESPRRGDSLDRFRNFLGAFIRLTMLR